MRPRAACWASFGSLAIAFSFCLSRKRQLQGSLGMLAMAFSPCLSRERRFQGSPRMPESGPLRMLGEGFDPSRLHFPPPCRRNIQVKAPWE